MHVNRERRRRQKGGCISRDVKPQPGAVPSGGSRPSVCLLGLSGLQGQLGGFACTSARPSEPPGSLLFQPSLTFSAGSRLGFYGAAFFLFCRQKIHTSKLYSHCLVPTCLTFWPVCVCAHARTSVCVHTRVCCTWGSVSVPLAPSCTAPRTGRVLTSRW